MTETTLQITYLFDPLCGWCHGASPVLARLREEGYALRLAPTGLFSGEGAWTLVAEALDHIRSADQRIAALSGQPFTETYQETLLHPGARLDSATATLGLTAVALTAPGQDLEALRALQMARYRDGRDITDRDTVAAALEETGLVDAAAYLRAPDAELENQNRSRTSAGKRLLSGVGAQGVPTVVVLKGEDRMLVPSGMLYGDPAPLLEALTKLVA